MATSMVPFTLKTTGNAAAPSFAFRPSASIEPAATSAAAAIDLTKAPGLNAGKSPSKFKLKVEPGIAQRTIELVANDAKPKIPTLTFAAPAASTLPEVPAAGPGSPVSVSPAGFKLSSEVVAEREGLHDSLSAAQQHLDDEAADSMPLKRKRKVGTTALPPAAKREPDAAIALQTSLLSGLRQINSICTRFTQKDLQALLTATSVVGAILGNMRQAKSEVRWSDAATVDLRTCIKKLHLDMARSDKANLVATNGHGSHWGLTEALQLAIQRVSDFSSAFGKHYLGISRLEHITICDKIPSSRLHLALRLIAKCAGAIRMRMDTFAIVGVQGSGKSTLVQILDNVIDFNFPCIQEDVARFKKILNQLLSAIEKTPATDIAKGNYKDTTRVKALGVQFAVLAAHIEREEPAVRERAATCNWVFSLVQLAQGLLTWEQFKDTVLHATRLGYLPAGIWLVRETPEVCKARASTRSGRAKEGATHLDTFRDVGAAYDAVYGMPELYGRLESFTASPSPAFAAPQPENVPSRNARIGRTWGVKIAAFFADYAASLVETVATPDATATTDGTDAMATTKAGGMAAIGRANDRLRNTASAAMGGGDDAAAGGGASGTD